MALSKEKIANSIVILCLAAFVLWYGVDTHNASSSLENIVLILPIVAITLCLCIYEFFTQNDMKVKEEEKESISSVIPVIILFTLYILSLEYLGFDIGTVLFLGLFLFFHGESRFPWILGYSLVYGFIIAYFFSQMLPYPMPMMILPTDY
ncbi:tripartite tricarboxylate transporter TctB family protein [Arcobacter arenosus]|uniref:Tripartite tricarboxylate transporter TctB family protein n=1 Tax=Arcobacter arenosus TaxID=2576037 RepID=A0A5R8Y4N6_9BACT|nr:tripartite tricarboxylate transporter TctB family protein [Arcobacter arenosus]TLP41084.1 tripartite tricarboxylate transporter TctB family protein [Arcobacter arenosus]